MALGRVARGLGVSAAGLAIFLTASPASAGFRVEKRLPLEPGGRFVLNTPLGSASIRGVPEDGARVVVTSDRDDVEERFAIRLDAKPGEVAVSVKRTSMLPRWDDVSLHFEIEVPRRTAVRLVTSGGSLAAESLDADVELRTSGGAIRAGDLGGSLAAATSGGAIDASGVKGSASLETSGGSVSASKIGGVLRASTSGGSIEVDDAASDLEGKTSGGPIRVSGARGRVVVSTSGGAIRVAFAHGNAQGGVLRTLGGSIRVALDPSVKLEIDASTSAGVVTSEVPLAARGSAASDELHGTLNGGGNRLVLETSAGSIRIEPL